MTSRNLDTGMGEAVARRTVLRYEDGKWEKWQDVAKRVTVGNTALHSTGMEDYQGLLNAISNATILMSGRHLQHGDESQPSRPIELFSNCSTSATSFLLFHLLMSGSGVGRCYDDDVMQVNWDYAPTVRCVLSEDHADFNNSAHESDLDAKHKYDNKDTFWFKVPDTREGWSQALEIWENAAFEKVHVHKTLVLDFSDVRPSGSIIQGMQGRPSSGPVPLMNAFSKSMTIKNTGMPRWKQAMYVDHYFAECVLVGGARRSARMSTKFWKDEDIMDFIRIKRPIRKGTKVFLWSSNNSIMVDKEFWDRVNNHEPIATRIFNTATQAGYEDGTGEPGFINVDKLNRVEEGLQVYNTDSVYVNTTRKFKIRPETTLMMKRIAKTVVKKKNFMTVNPCVRGNTLVLTPQGYQPIQDLVGKKVSVWNGQQWSMVEPKITGTNQKMLRVKFSDGTKIDVTPYHGFHIQQGFSRSEVLLKEARQLQIGDRLKKYDMPTITIGTPFPLAYEHGFFCGDGFVYGDKKLAWMYHQKQELIPEMELVGVGHSYNKRTRVRFDDSMPDKFVVPLQADMTGRLAWLSGLIDADGTASENGLQIGSIHKKFLNQIRLMLTTMGVQAKVSKPRPGEFRDMPDGHGGNKEYWCRKWWRLLINHVDTNKLYKLGLETKRVIWDSRAPQRDARRFVTVTSITKAPIADKVYCFNEPINHTGTFNGIVTGQCSEVPLHILGALCIIGDVVPFHAETLDEAEESFRLTTRALIRTNLMEAIYSKEVQRTNRIGVGITGVHEYAWKFFQIGFRDMINPALGPDPTKYREHASVRAAEFWRSLNRFANAVDEEARSYSKELGLSVPHTMRVVKPSGSVSKLFGLTEGWHLPAMPYYLRWVQFKSDDPLVEQYKLAGYPTKELQTYHDVTIIGFPTAQLISRLIPEDQLVMADQATVEEQYEWLRLGEQYWIGSDNGAQISYTLKYKPSLISLDQFREALLKNQPTVRCCAVLPISETQTYEYLPEQFITKAEYEDMMRQIKVQMEEDIDRVHLDCAGGLCPVDYNALPVRLESGGTVPDLQEPTDELSLEEVKGNLREQGFDPDALAKRIERVVAEQSRKVQEPTEAV